MITFFNAADPQTLLALQSRPHQEGNASFWGGVAASLQLTQAQRQRLAPVLQQPLAVSEPLHAARHRLLAAQQVLLLLCTQAWHCGVSLHSASNPFAEPLRSQHWPRGTSLKASAVS